MNANEFESNISETPFCTLKDRISIGTLINLCYISKKGKIIEECLLRHLILVC